ncbi:tetratricopeptide repeat protein [Runella sp.]|uniref:tetratricopeptide repeat protein n=1 Tax=Runella sp. TaxID=1960881 RepID=UPI0026213727|nr:tetratricopeptide repeat protein [Runella sp.]
MGQILSDEGDQDEAINCLIDALRWDPKNGWALLMMGNIFAKFKDDIPTAMKYYDQALLANVRDFISLTNIGYLLLQENSLEKAKKYFNEALKINPNFPNVHFGLGMIAEKENDIYRAFEATVEAIKLNKNKDILYENSVRRAFDFAKNIVESEPNRQLFIEYRHQLEFAGGTEIDIVEDTAIPTAAKIEFAENYDRPKHTVKYKPKYPAIEHLIMHELVHLAFVIDARKAGLNQLFIANQQHKTAFIKKIEPILQKFQKMGISADRIANYSDRIFNGLNLQIYNTPIDLFIEDFLYQTYPALRPAQFLSLNALIQEGLKATTDKKTLELSPKEVLSKSKIYTLVIALQYKALFGIDFIKDFQASTAELKQAQSFYEEYLQYKTDKEPAEEYELIMNWAEDLQLNQNFELVDELQYRSKRLDFDNLLDAIEKDPYDLDSNDPYKQREMEKFQKSQANIKLNSAVMMYMAEALKHFAEMPQEAIQKVAFEIATQGTQGFSTEKADYRISSISGKTFSGYHILAYYYVSWALAMPEMLSQLQLPYDEEYKMALSIHKPSNQ